MLTMAVGYSDDVAATDATAAAIAQCRDALGGRSPQAGLLISAFDTFEPSIAAAVRAAFPGVRLVGTTSAAELSSAGGFREDSLTLALFASDSVEFGAGLGSGLAADVDAACHAAASEALASMSREPRVCVVFAEAFSADPPRTLRALARALPPGVAIVGGASSRIELGRVRPTYQLCDERIAEDGLALLLLSEPVAWSVAVGTGWQGIGPEGTVTRAEGSVVQEIDGLPALAFVARYLDETGPASFGNPMAVYEDGVLEPYLRVALGSDAGSGTVTLMGSVPVGARVRITTAATEDILDGASGALARAARDFPERSTPEAALIFSCAVRRFLLGSRTRRESELAREALGRDVPFAGLYCNGEIAPLGGAPGSRFLNETFVTLLLGT